MNILLHTGTIKGTPLLVKERVEMLHTPVNPVVCPVSLRGEAPFGEYTKRRNAANILHGSLAWLMIKWSHGPVERTWPASHGMSGVGPRAASGAGGQLISKPQPCGLIFLSLKNTTCGKGLGARGSGLVARGSWLRELE